jgi:putative permease
MILVLLFVFVFILVGIEFLPQIKEYMIIFAKKVPSYYDRFVLFLDDTFSSIDFVNQQPAIANLKQEMQKYLDRKIYIFASIVERIASKRDAITSFFSFFVIMPIAFFYFLRDWNVLTTTVCNSIPNRQKDVVFKAFSIVRQTFTNFFKGQLCVVAILSVYYTLSLAAVGACKCVFLGIVSGFFSFIPFIGALFSFLLVIFVNVSKITLVNFCVIFAIYLIGQFLEGYVLTPKFVAKKTGLHPLWILFSFFAGIQLQGISGVLIAIPLTAVTRNLVVFAIKEFKASPAYKQ